MYGNSQGKLLMVADGMGGHETGERASQLVLDTIIDYILNKLDWVLNGEKQTEEHFIKQLKESLAACQTRLEKESKNVPTNRQMGSTLTLLYVVWPRAFVIHVGDSRCYLSRSNLLKQVTRDHTVAQLHIDGKGLQTDLSQIAVVAPNHNPMSHVLWNVIGGGSMQPKPDAMVLDLEIGDTLLLCTDGISNAVPINKIGELLNSDLPSSSICERLIAEANSGGGDDNITVIVSKFLKEMSMETLIDELAVPNRFEADTDEFKISSMLASDEVNELSTKLL